jgi:hypothetical protein
MRRIEGFLFFFKGSGLLKEREEQQNVPPLKGIKAGDFSAGNF